MELHINGLIDLPVIFQKAAYSHLFDTPPSLGSLGSLGTCGRKSPAMICDHEAHESFARTTVRVFACVCAEEMGCFRLCRIFSVSHWLRSGSVRDFHCELQLRHLQHLVGTCRRCFMLGDPAEEQGPQPLGNIFVEGLLGPLAASHGHAWPQLRLETDSASQH